MIKTTNATAHPNKRVQEHDKLLVNKVLANKVRTVKSTISSTNDAFERRLESSAPLNNISLTSVKNFSRSQEKRPSTVLYFILTSPVNLFVI